MKKLLILPFFLLCLAPLHAAHASVQVLSGGTSVNAGVLITTFYQFADGNSNSATSETVTTYMPVAGTFSTFYANATSSPGAGTYYIVSIRKNASDTPLGCIIDGSSTSCNDLFHSVSVAAGDGISISITPIGSPTGLFISWSFLFTPSTPNDTIVSYRTGSALSTTLEQYMRPFSDGGVLTISATESQTQSIFGEGGTLDLLTAKFVAGSPGTGSNYTFTMRQNAGTSTLSCAIADTNTSCTDSSNSVSVTAGDLLDLASVPSTGTVPTARAVGWGARFVPATAGDFLFISSGQTNSQGANTTSFERLSGEGTNAGVESTAQQVVASAMTMTTLKVKTDAAPGGAGGARTRIYTLRKNGSDTSLTCTITDSNTACTGTGSVSVAAGDVLDIKQVTNASVVTAHSYFSIVANGAAVPSNTVKTVVLDSGAGSGNQSWTVPADFTSSNMIECIGAGGDGAASVSGTSSGGGGSGGVYGRTENLSLTGSVTYNLAAHGASGTGADTYFNSTASTTAALSCPPGKNAVTTSAGAVPTLANSFNGIFVGGIGGTGSPASNRGGGGGGGSGGPWGAGKAGAAGGNGTVGGGGGADGGLSSAGSTAGVGGNGYLGTGGGSRGSNATAGTGGGGGGGATIGTGSGFAGAIDNIFDSLHGAGGGGGGGSGTSGLLGKIGGSAGAYGGGGAGGGSGAGLTAAGGAGGQGLIVITYVSNGIGGGGSTHAQTTLFGGHVIIIGGRIYIQ